MPEGMDWIHVLHLLSVLLIPSEDKTLLSGVSMALRGIVSYKAWEPLNNFQAAC